MTQKPGLAWWLRSPLRLGVIGATLCDKVCQWIAAGRWFSPGTPVSSTSKTDRHDITEILLKVALNTITLTRKPVQKLSNFFCTSFVLIIQFIQLWLLKQIGRFFYTKPKCALKRLRHKSLSNSLVIVLKKFPSQNTLHLDTLSALAVMS